MDDGRTFDDVWFAEMRAGREQLEADLAALRAENERLRSRQAAAEAVLHEIVCTEPPDDGVVLLSNDSPCDWDAEHKIYVYDHDHFSPLGDALMKLYRVLSGEKSNLETLIVAADGVCKTYPQRAMMRPHVQALRKWLDDNPGWLTAGEGSPTQGAGP